MQINSYTFQSPYSQPFQVGRPDPASSKQEPSIQNTPEMEKKTSTGKEAKVATTQGSGITVSLNALQEGNSQKSVAEFKSLSTSLQAQKAYVQDAAS